MALETKYDVWTASKETTDAMRERCAEQGHWWEKDSNRVPWAYRFQEPSAPTKRCKWCGAVA